MSSITYVFTLGLVQHITLLPLAVGSLVGLADVELHLGAFLVLHGLPLIQGHLLGSLFLNLFNLVLPGRTQQNNVSDGVLLWLSNPQAKLSTFMKTRFVLNLFEGNAVRAQY